MERRITGGAGSRERLIRSLAGGAAQSAIGDLLAARLDLDAAAGVVVAVTDELDTLGVVTSGRADLATGTPMEAGSLLQIGSIGKTFTSIAALQLVEAGRLDLHASLDACLPWFGRRACRDASGAPVTMHHLLTHTSGLPLGTEYCDSPLHIAWAWGQREGWAAPGRRLAYSNDGFKIAGVIIEAVSGECADRYVAAHILQPLHMDASRARITAEDRCRAATGYVRAARGGSAQRHHHRCVAPWVVGASADGSVISSGPDLCALVRMLLRGGLTDDGGRLLSPASWATMRRAHVGIPAGLLGSFGQDAQLGYGLFSGELDGHRCVWHPGRMPGFSALILADVDDQLGVVVLANGEAHIEQIALHALRAARSARRDQAPPLLPVVDPCVCDVPEAFAGLFIAGDPDTLPREADLRADGEYVTLAADGERVRLEPSRFARDAFLVPLPGWERYLLRVLRGAEGLPMLLTHGPRWWMRATAEHDVAAVLPPPACPTSVVADSVQGRYSSHNRFFPCLDIFARRGGLLLTMPGPLGRESPLVEIGEGVFRVGEEDWHPERLVFDAFIDGRPTRARLDFETYYREECDGSLC